MRSIDIGFSYVQAVGRIKGNNLTCTSLGTQTPINVGDVDAVSANGVSTRLNRSLSSASSDSMAVVSQGDFAVVSDQALLFDTPREGPDVSLALFMPSSPKHIMMGTVGDFGQDVFEPLKPGQTTTSIRNGRIIAAYRSNRYDLQAVSSVPVAYAYRRVKQFALERVPLGLVGGAVLAWAVLYLSRTFSSLSAVMRGAVKRHEFYVEYQPVVELETGRWVGAEALVRWRRGEHAIPPNEFIPIAESQGVITEITGEVMNIVARDLPSLVELDPHFHVAINLSAADIRSEETLPRLRRMLEKSGVRVENIVVEATERGFLQGPESSRMLNAISGEGYAISIDDFGTGYSSLSALGTLPLDELKIDKSFVETIGTDGVTSGVVLHIIEIAKAMNLQIVAEGVETAAQAQFLRSKGVNYAQGWLFSRPLPIHALHTQLANRTLQSSPHAAVFSNG